MPSHSSILGVRGNQIPMNRAAMVASSHVSQYPVRTSSLAKHLV